MPQIEQKFERWDDEIHHPSERCHGQSQNHGQCPFKKVGGSDYCMRHGAGNALAQQKEQELRNYRLTKYRARVSELANADGIKSLREEVGILRMILEETLNRCEDTNDILMYSTRMSDLVIKIEKLVVSCDKMESKMGMLLSRDSVLQLAGEFVGIITEHVTDNDIVETISMKMVQATMRIEATTEAHNARTG